MAHTAEDLCEFSLKDRGYLAYEHSDVRHGFILIFNEKPKVDLNDLEHEVNELIEQNLPISYLTALIFWSAINVIIALARGCT